MGRQELLTRDPAPNVRVILNEGALRRPVPNAKVWSEQLSHLVDAAELPNVVIQVLPFTAGVHDLMDSHLWLFWQPGSGQGAALPFVLRSRPGRGADPG